MTHPIEDTSEYITDETIIKNESLESLNDSDTDMNAIENENVHEDDQNKYECKICGKNFNSEKGLNIHLSLIHENLYIDDKLKNNCKICQKTFDTPNNLQSHLVSIHQYEATVNKIVSHWHKSDATVQKTIETVNPHEENEMKETSSQNVNKKCELCGKTFCNEGYLKEHINSVHEGIKSFKCDTCGKAFSRAGKLKHHIMTVHEGIKKHKCHICGNCFSEKAKLRRHLLTIHQYVETVHKIENENGGIHKCDLCGKTFSQVYRLRSHINGVHYGGMYWLYTKQD